jgi:hypothetical protein
MIFYHEVVVEPPDADFRVEGDLQRLREDRLRIEAPTLA